MDPVFAIILYNKEELSKPISADLASPSIFATAIVNSKTDLNNSLKRFSLLSDKLPLGFPGGSVVKNLLANTRDLG